MTNEINKETETEVVENLGPMQFKAGFDFKKALHKAMENPVDCGIFAYIEQQKKTKKEKK